jgi:hypothetical protein
MATLSELTTFTNQTLSFTDNRTPDVKFTWPSARDIAAELGNVLTFAVQRKIDIEEVIQPAAARAYYEIDVSSVSGATVSWSTVPSGMTVTVVSAGVYRISYINSVADWNTVAAPTITLPVTFIGSMQYTASIVYNDASGVQTVSWTVGEEIPLIFLSNIFTSSITAKRFVGMSPNLYVDTTLAATANTQIVDQLLPGTTTEVDYIPGTTETFGTATPQLNSISSDPVIYTVTITTDTPSILLNFAYIGPTPDVGFAYNSSTKTATLSGISGDVNAALQLVTFDVIDSPIAYYWPFVITVSVVDNYSLEYQEVTISAVATDDTYNTQPTADTYSTNIATRIEGAPEVDPNNLIVSGNYTTVITPFDPSQVTSLSGAVASGELTATQRNEIDTSGTNNDLRTGNPVISETGTRVFLPGTHFHRVYTRSSGALTLENSWAAADYNVKDVDDDIFVESSANSATGGVRPSDMSDDGLYVAFAYQNDYESFEPWYVNIAVRSGTTWSDQAQIGPFDGADEIINVKFNPAAGKILIVKNNGYAIYSRSGSTWSSVSSGGTDTYEKSFVGSGYSYTITYTDRGQRRVGFNTVGANDRSVFGMHYDSISPAITPSDPGYSAVAPYLNKGLYKIYRDGTLEEEFISYYGSDTTLTAADFNEDATKVVIRGTDSSMDDARIYSRSGTNWSFDETLSVSDSQDVVIADSTTDQRIVVLEQQSSANNNQLVLHYFKEDTGTFVKEFDVVYAEDANSTPTEHAKTCISGDGDYFGLINPGYAVGSDYGRFREYEAVTYSGTRTQTATKELTILANKADTNDLIRGYLMTPATDENETIKLVYTITDPNSVITSRIQDIDNV